MSFHLGNAGVCPKSVPRSGLKRMDEDMFNVGKPFLSHLHEFCRVIFNGKRICLVSFFRAKMRKVSGCGLNLPCLGLVSLPVSN